MSNAHNSMTSSELLSSSHSSLGSSKKGSSEISRIYKQASQLFLTRRLAEALQLLDPVVAPPVYTNGHVNGDDGPSLALIATAPTSQRIKIWSLYITLLNAIVDLEAEEGKRGFGQKEYKALVAKVRGGEIWDQVVRDGYSGRDGSVDAEVVYNLATLLLGQAPSQTLNQSRLETYLSSSAHPDLDVSSHLARQTSRRSQHHINGTDTPKDLNSRLKILELFTLHVLPRNEEWDYARSFISNSDILDDERREAFLQTLQEIQETADADDGQEDVDYQQERDEELQIQQQADEARRAQEAAVSSLTPSTQNGSLHRRTSSEVDYGIEKSHPNGTTSTGVGEQNSKPPKASAVEPPRKSPGRTHFSPPAETPRHRHVRKRSQSQSNGMLAQALHLMRALQNLIQNMAGAIRANPSILYRAFFLTVAVIMAFSRQEVRERVKRMLSASWEKTRRTVGMGVKVSYV